MANTIVNRVIENGPRNLITQHTLYSSTAAGPGDNESAVAKVSVASLVVNVPASATTATAVIQFAKLPPNLSPGMTIVDTTTGGNIPAGTTVKSIDYVLNTVTASAVTTVANGDNIQFGYTAAVLGLSNHLKIRRVIYNITQLVQVQALWDATTPVQAMTLTGYGDMDMQDTQGIFNDALAGVTGNILFTTVFPNTNPNVGTTGGYTIFLQMIKGI